ncbi:MAG: Zn-ribbon domain-containing OB-fold protein [Actinomycetota bacterium]
MAAKPIPAFSAISQPYWEAAREGRLTVQRCDFCRLWQHFPESRCPACGSTSLHFEAVSGRGTIDTFTVVHRSFVPGFDDEAPYAVGWIALPEQPGLRVFADFVGIDHDSLFIGMPVEVTFTTRSGWGTIPSFAAPTPDDEDTSS